MRWRAARRTLTRWVWLWILVLGVMADHPRQDNLPSMSDLNADNLTDLVHLIDGKCPNPRQKFLMDKLVQHLHDYVRETQLTTEEWM
jgi:hypothetical protein